MTIEKSIWSPKGVPNGTCCKIPYKGYEISLASDDSCGVMKNYGRTEIRVFREWDDADVSAQFFRKGESMLYGYASTLQHIFSWIDMFGDRD